MIDNVFNIITGLFLSKITILLIDAIAIYLAVVVYRDNKNGKLNKVYVVMTFLMLCWVNFAYALHLTGYEHFRIGLLLLKIAWLATPLFFIFLYWITILLINKEEKYKFLTKITFSVGLICAVGTGFTNKIISGVQFPEKYTADIIYGPWMYPFLGIVFLIIVATLFPIFKRDILKEDKVRHFLMGIFIFYFANAVFNITLPVFFGVSRFYFFGDYSTIILLSYTAYSILRHELFNIKVMAAEVLTFAIWIILAMEVFTSTDIRYQIGRGIILLIVVIFGLLLIRSVKNEIRQREKLEVLTKQLKSANIKLKKLDAAKSEFISIASHQLRTPLTVIKGYLSMVMLGDFGAVAEKEKDPLEKVYESTERLIQLVENLLNVSRIESGRLQFNFKVMRLEDLVSSVMEELYKKAKDKGLELIYLKPEKPLPKIKIDEEKIRQVVTNLIDNSIKYTEKGKVEVGLKESGGKIEFCVADTGSGLKKEDMPKLFEKFSRGTTKYVTHNQGTGLGLYVARQMVEAHKGKIFAESKGEDKGSSFRFTLPV